MFGKLEDCMTEVFVEVRGGVLVESYSESRDVIVKLIDWDNIHGGDEPVAGVIPCLPIELMSEDTFATTGRKLQDN
jgi:hypothetical protein